MNTGLQNLSPARRHYQHYFASPDAAADMEGTPDEISSFLNAYFYAKSAGWSGNRPHPLENLRAESLAQLPTYYVMNLGETMPETVAAYMADAENPACPWLSPDDLAVYGEEYSRTGFQGGLNWYRARLDGIGTASAAFADRFAGSRIKGPGCYIAGKSDWGMHQTPGVFDAMPAAFEDWRGARLIDRAGHWVQQEQPQEVILRLRKFLTETVDGG
jgi:pimeloyl-ACP methyl ester carboxylesterase